MRERVGMLTTSAVIRPSPIPLLRQADSLIRLDSAHRRGEVHRVAPAVYAPSELWAQLSAWDRYLARVHAHAVTHPDAVFAFESAMALRGAPVAGALDEVHVLSGGTAARLVRGVRLHVSRDAREVRSEGGLLLVSVEDTAVDIARARHPAVGLLTADASLRMLERDDVEPLIARNEQRSSSRGRANARWSLSRATSLSETSLESVSRAAIEWLGYPPPELQVTFVAPDGTVDRPDMYWREENVIGEADGRVKYDGTHGDGAQNLWHEKRREDRLRRRAAGFARWSHSDVVRVDPLDDALRSAGLRAVRPRESGRLHTLRRALTGARFTPAPRIQVSPDSERGDGFSRHGTDRVP